MATAMKRQAERVAVKRKREKREKEASKPVVFEQADPMKMHSVDEILMHYQLRHHLYPEPDVFRVTNGTSELELFGFRNKTDAKQARNALNRIAVKPFWVTIGVDHWKFGRV
jgi:hypothetical protein